MAPEEPSTSERTIGSSTSSDDNEFVGMVENQSTAQAIRDDIVSHNPQRLSRYLPDSLNEVQDVLVLFKLLSEMKDVISDNLKKGLENSHQNLNGSNLLYFFIQNYRAYPFAFIKLNKNKFLYFVEYGNDNLLLEWISYIELWHRLSAIFVLIGIISPPAQVLNYYVLFKILKYFDIKRAFDPFWTKIAQVTQITSTLTGYTLMAVFVVKLRKLLEASFRIDWTLFFLMKRTRIKKQQNELMSYFRTPLEKHSSAPEPMETSDREDAPLMREDAPLTHGDS